MVVIYVLGWVVCGFLAYGFGLGASPKQFPYMRHERECRFISLLGPFGLFAIAVVDGFGTWRLKPTTYNERLAIFLSEYSLLGQEYFDARYK